MVPNSFNSSTSLGQPNEENKQNSQDEKRTQGEDLYGEESAHGFPLRSGGCSEEAAIIALPMIDALLDPGLGPQALRIPLAINFR